ncbi:hypothetical protein PG989_010571 [Apiospora arundinis]
MTSNAPIPVLLCGKIPGHIKATTEILRPEFEVIETCSSLEAARTAISEMLSPSSAKSDSATKPRVVLMGGRVPPGGLLVRLRHGRGCQVGPLGPSRHFETGGGGRGGHCSRPAPCRGRRRADSEDVGGANGGAAREEGPRGDLVDVKGVRGCSTEQSGDVECSGIPCPFAGGVHSLP